MAMVMFHIIWCGNIFHLGLFHKRLHWGWGGLYETNQYYYFLYHAYTVSVLSILQVPSPGLTKTDLGLAILLNS